MTSYHRPNRAWRHPLSPVFTNGFGDCRNNRHRLSHRNSWLLQQQRHGPWSTRTQRPPLAPTTTTTMVTTQRGETNYTVYRYMYCTYFFAMYSCLPTPAWWLSSNQEYMPALTHLHPQPPLPAAYHHHQQVVASLQNICTITNMGKMQYIVL